MIAQGSDARARARAMLDLTRAEGFRRPALETYELLLTEAAPVERTDPGLAALMLADAVTAAVGAGDHERAVATARRASVLAGSAGDPDVAAHARLAEGVALAVGGRGDHVLREVLERREELGRSLAVGSPRAVAAAVLWSEEYEVARRLLEAVIERQREQRAHELAGCLDTLAAVDYRTGRWTSAHARSSEAARIAAEAEASGQLASCLTTLARIAASRGNEHECRARAAEALALVTSDDVTYAYAVSAVGLLELGLDRPEEAAATLEQLLHVPSHAVRDPLVVQWLPDLVEACVRSRRREDADALARDLERRAHESARPWLHAVALRCRGLCDEVGFEARFEAALSWHDRANAPFERARTELVYGERLRRRRRYGEARPLLRSAVAAFERLGASGWAARARRELAPPRRSRPEAATPAELLTPHELQVAVVVARGARNREAAATLFVSEKTIEYHLSAIYRKLGVRTRTELSNVLR